MTRKPKRWGKWIGITVLVLFGAVAIAVAAIPGLRQGLGLLWAYNANSFAADEWGDERPSHTMPFRHDGYILIPVTVQNKRAIDVALDTGAPMTALIGGPHLDGLALETGSTVPIGGSGQGASPTAQILRNLDLAVGAASFSGLTALLIPWGQMGEYFTSPEQVFIHGILGYDLFSRYVVEIDFESEILTLHRPDEFDYAGNGEVVPFTFVQRKPYVEADITQSDGTSVPVKLQVDLGKPSALSLIPSATAQITVPADAIAAESRGLSGRVDERMSRLHSLRFGQYELRDVVTSFSIEGFATAGDRNGVVGLDVLSRFRVFIDYPHDRMILEPNASIDQPFEYDMSGVSWIPHGDTYRVRRIRADSPGEHAGLQVDDELISIDGREPSDVRLGDLVGRMRAGEGVEIALELQRGGGFVSVVLVLRRQI